MRAQNLAPNPAPNLAQNLARNLAYVFDHSGKVRRPSLRLTLGEVRSLVPFGGCAPDATGIANGRGHVVLLVPGWFTTDGVNRSLQEFLTVCGYRAFGWKLGMNWGPTPRLIRGLEERLAELRELEGGPVSVVGLSLGGVLARDLGHRCPRDVRQVITIASPFRLPTASRLEPLFQLLSRWYAPEFDVVRLSTPLPMPATAIYTREDGIVAWESCRDDGDCEAVEVGGSHFAVCRNPDVLCAVARQLGRGLKITSA